MREFIRWHIGIEDLLCALVLLSRLGDIGSIYLVSPTLNLEANSIARRLGWEFAWSSLLVCLIPYYSAPASIVVLVPSFMVSASNSMKIWFARSQRV